MMKNCIKILIFFIFSYFALIGISIAEECNKKKSSYTLNKSGYNFTKTKEWEKALTCFKLSVKKDNNPYAQSWIGTIYDKGYGVPENYKLAFKWFSLAAEQGDVYSIGKIGWHYMEGRGVAQNDEEAVKWFRKGAELGDAYSQERLGWYYAEGLGGLKQDWNKSFEWTLKAARQEDVYAMSGVGWHYMKGKGVAQKMAHSKGKGILHVRVIGIKCEQGSFVLVHFEKIVHERTQVGIINFIAYANDNSFIPANGNRIVNSLLEHGDHGRLKALAVLADITLSLFTADIKKTAQIE